MKKIIIPLAMIGAGFAVLSLAKPKFSQTPSTSTAVEAAATSSHAAAKPSDLTGEWELDPSRSDAPWMRGGGGNGGPRPGGDGANRFRGGTGPNGPRGQGRMRLPQHFEITQTGALVSFTDLEGRLVQEIATNSDTTASAAGVIHRLGTWNGSALEVSRQGRGGATFVESWTLQDQSTLVCTTHVSGGDMGDRTMKRVYRRVKES